MSKIKILILILLDLLPFSYNTFSPDTVKKMPKADLVDEVLTYPMSLIQLVHLFYYPVICLSSNLIMPLYCLLVQIWRLQEALSVQSEITKISQEDYENFQNVNYSVLAKLK